MSQKTRNLIIGVLLGAGGVIGGLAGCNGSAASSPGPTVPSTLTLAPRPTTVVITHSATELPESYFDVTVDISVSATEVAVDDTIVVTLTITNTGGLDVFQSYCSLYGWVEGGSPDAPFVEPNSQSEDAKALNPGEQATCTFTIKAIRSADDVMLQGGYSGKVYFSPDNESDRGNHSPILKIKISPENP